MAYFVTFYIVLTAVVVSVPRRNVAIILGGVVAFAFAAARFNAGNDYLAYYSFIVEGETSRFEPLARALMEVARNTSPQVFFVVSAAIVVGFNVATLLHLNRRVGISRLAIIAFISLPAMFIESLGYVRQFCAIAIMLYAFVRRDKPLLAIALALVALGFHFAAVVYIPVGLALAIWNRAIPAWVYAGFFVASFFASDLLRIVSQRTGFYSHYFDFHAAPYGRSAMLLFGAIFVGLLLTQRHRFTGRVRQEFNLLFLGVCLYAALAPYGGHLARGAWYAIGIAPALLGVALRGRTMLARVFMMYFFAGLFFYQVYLGSRNATWNFLTDYQIYALTEEEERLAILERFWEARR